MRKTTLITLALLAIAPRLAAGNYTKNVAIVIFDGVEILDLAAPAEVFAMAARYGANGHEPAFNVYTVATNRATVTSQGFVNITPDYSISEAPKPDIVVLPGGRGSWNAIKDDALMTWIRKSADAADHVLTICYGAFIAGNAGLLDGLEITTWYGSLEMLEHDFPKSRAVAGRRFIDNGKVITTAGVSAGLDGSLHLVARTLGRYVADRTAEYMEYPWAPQSYTSSTYPEFNPRLDAHGRKLQEAAIDASAMDITAAVKIYSELVAADPADNEAWLNLGRVQLSAKNYSEAITAYVRASNGAAQRASALYDLACAYALSGDSEKAIDAASRAVEAGFTARAMFSHDPSLESLRSDARFKRLMEP